MLRWLSGILCVLCLFPACRRTQEEASLTILFTGDVLLDRSIRPMAERRGTAWLFNNVTPVFRQADAVVINLECPLTTRTTPLNKRFIFRGEPEWAKDLRQVGITHAAIANNHTNDQGRQGLADTYQALHTSGITPLGYGYSMEEQLTPTVIRKKGIKVAVFNAVLFPLENWQYAEGQPDVCRPSIDRLTSRIRQYKAEHPSSFIVAVLHWGTEFQPHPHVQQRHYAHKLMQAGTDAIIGHHPHVVQPMEYINSRPVFYSLGNFVFDQSHPDCRKAVMALLRFKASGVQAKAIPIEIRQCKPQIIRKQHENR